MVIQDKVWKIGFLMFDDDNDGIILLELQCNASLL